MKGNGTYFLEYCWPKNRSPLSKDPDAHRDEIYSIRQLSKDPEVHSIRQKSIQHAAIYKNEPHAFVKSIWVVDDAIMMTSSWTNQCWLCLVHAPTCPPSWIMKARFFMTSSWTNQRDTFPRLQRVLTLHCRSDEKVPACVWKTSDWFEHF